MTSAKPSTASASTVRRAVAVMAVAALSGLAVTSLSTAATAATPAGPRIYYVSPTGSDTYAGTSPTSAWSSLAKVSKANLLPGDRVLFARGGTWAGHLVFTSSGTTTAPITVDAYGTGKLPIITTGGNGECVKIAGNNFKLKNMAVTSCPYAGFTVTGDYDNVNNSEASNNSVGLHVSKGASFNSFQYDRMINNNRMAVNTKGTNCHTAKAVLCTDDSGGTGFVINGDDNNFGHNTVSGSIAVSYDFGYDGSAFEIFNSNRNVIHDNVSKDNLVLSEIGRSGAGETASGNVYLRNTVSATCGAPCDGAGGITLRGTASMFGPNVGTVIDRNTFDLPGANTNALICHAWCPNSTVITNNTLRAARAIFVDGTGWDVHNNTLVGATVGSVGTHHYSILAGSSVLQ